MSAVCQERGPKPGDVIGALCACGHVNVVHDAGGCAVCALRVIAPASDPQPPTLREQVARAMHDAYEARAAEVGWETQARSRVAWADVPEANKQAMYAAVDAALAVVADWLAAQPLVGDSGYPALDAQRDHDVRLVREEAS